MPFLCAHCNHQYSSYILLSFHFAQISVWSSRHISFNRPQKQNTMCSVQAFARASQASTKIWSVQKKNRECKCLAVSNKESYVRAFEQKRKFCRSIQTGFSSILKYWNGTNSSQLSECGKICKKLTQRTARGRDRERERVCSICYTVVLM